MKKAEMRRYKIHDNCLTYYEEKIVIAENLGYDYVSESYEKMFKSGKLPSEIAEIFKTSDQAIRDRLRLLGISMRVPGGHNNTKLSEKKVKEILTGGEKKSFYAQKFGVSICLVHAVIKRKAWKWVQI